MISNILVLTKVYLGYHSEFLVQIIPKLIIYIHIQKQITKGINFMENTVTLQTMKCPTCGGKLKVENPNEPIECIYCGNNIVPVNNNVSVANTNNSNAITNA